MSKRSLEEKYDGLFRIPNPVDLEPTIEFTNDKMDFKIIASMIIFKNLNINKYLIFYSNF